MRNVIRPVVIYFIGTKGIFVGVVVRVPKQASEWSIIGLSSIYKIHLIRLLISTN